ncbi:MAG: zinc-binding dehydrogenase [Candidatus Methanoperedens sp.]|nr:zinc-binding dehydrogenase [Candidatus Methanoperedens sp.]MCZ7394902.1 zinc-binding dehydrogenase [Candidatus Methanoperedens sp.]
MLALVKTKKGTGNIDLIDVEIPRIGVNEVLIKVQAAGICGTDIHVKNDEFPYWPPVILGHEFSGNIIEIGSDVKDYRINDRVVAEPHTLACGKCYYCRTGNIQICSSKRSIGWGIDGAFAEYIKMPERLLHRIPDNISYENAAVVEPTANVVHDVLERGKIEPQDFVVVLGPGPIGLLAAMAAKAQGAREVAIVGTPEDENLRLKIAKDVGIDYVINLAEEDPLSRILELTDNNGADLVVEASGAEPAINMAVNIVRKKGRITVIGMTGKKKIEVLWDTAIFKACDVLFNFSTSYTSWNRAISMIGQGKINIGAIITHREPLANWEKAFDAVENKKAIKALLIP